MIAGTSISDGLGNRLFQLSFLYSLAKRNQIGFHYDKWDTPSYHSQNTYRELMSHFTSDPLYVPNPPMYNKHVHEGYNDFTNRDQVDVWSKLVLEEKNSGLQNMNVHIRGFFQTEAHFKDYAHDIRSFLKEPVWVTEKIQGTYEREWTKEQQAQSVFLHVRLGDFLHNIKHFIDLNLYYSRCMEMLKNLSPNATVVVFSDDLDRIKTVYPHLDLQLKNFSCVKMDESDELVCLYMMSRCHLGGICPNSTFSWWGSWLNPNPTKNVFMPSRWVNEPLTDAAGIYPEGALVVSVV